MTDHAEPSAKTTPEYALMPAYGSRPKCCSLSHAWPPKSSRRQPVVRRSGGIDRLFKKNTQQGDGICIEITEDTVYIDIYVALKNDMIVRDVSREIQHEVRRAPSPKWSACRLAASTSTSKILIIRKRLRVRTASRLFEA